MLWCTGLESNSLTGSPKRSTNGCATYTYRCHPLLTTNPGQFWGRPLQFLFVIGLDAGQLGYSLKTEGNELTSTAIRSRPPRMRIENWELSIDQIFLTSSLCMHKTLTIASM